MDDISGGGTSFILQHDGTSTLFKHDTTERMRIDSSGNVGIGTSSPDAPLTLNGSSSSRLNMRAGDTRYGTLFADSGIFAVSSIGSIPLVMGTNDTERMRIEANGHTKIIYGASLTGGAGTGIYLTNSGLAPDGYAQARITESWGMSFSNQDPRWAPNITNTSLLVGLTSSGANFGVGNIIATGNITAYYSDMRLKTSLGNIEGALDKLLTLDGFRYVNNDLAKSFGYDKEEAQLGLSAQQVQAIAPEVVTLAPFDSTGDDDLNGDGKIYSKSGENYLTVDYARLVPLLVEAIKELTAKVETLETKLAQKEH